MYRFILKNTFIKIYIYHFLINIFIKINSQNYILETVSLFKTTLCFLDGGSMYFSQALKGSAHSLTDSQGSIGQQTTPSNPKVEWQQRNRSSCLAPAPPPPKAHAFLQIVAVRGSPAVHPSSVCQGENVQYKCNSPQTDTNTSATPLRPASLLASPHTPHHRCRLQLLPPNRCSFIALRRNGVVLLSSTCPPALAASAASLNGLLAAGGWLANPPAFAEAQRRVYSCSVVPLPFRFHP